jgi:Flp pilus assembly protein TadG
VIPGRGRHPNGQSLVEFALVLPLLLIFFLAVADFARIYTTMVTVESAAREAADQGAWNSSFWEGDPLDPTSNYAKTIVAMTERACVASRTLPDYVGPDTGCTNPSLTVELQEPDGTPGINCDDETRVIPCRVVATLHHDFHLIVPVSIEMFGVRVGFPSTLTFERTSMNGVARSRKRKTRGQALVEFALVAPLFFLFMFAIIEGARFVFYNEMLNNATREGARYAIVHGGNTKDGSTTPPFCASGPAAPSTDPCDVPGANVKEAVRTGAIGLIDTGTLSIPDPIWTVANDDLPNPGDASSGTNARGNYVTVFVDYSYSPIIPLLPSINISARSSLVINN